jgi:hypothetical protein
VFQISVVERHETYYFHASICRSMNRIPGKNILFRSELCVKRVVALDRYEASDPASVQCRPPTQYFIEVRLLVSEI